MWDDPVVRPLRIAGFSVAGLVVAAAIASAAAPAPPPHLGGPPAERQLSWARVVRHAEVFAGPTTSSELVTTLSTTFRAFPDLTRLHRNVVLVLSCSRTATGANWCMVRLARLPNGSTGWVRRRNLGPLHAVHVHLYVDRDTDTLTLKRDSKPILTVPVGVGQPYWPTPGGEFYVRGKETGYHNKFFGPIAMPTSACSTVLTDWPGGPCMAVLQGTDPTLAFMVPGHPSHGEIRLLNADIIRVARLTPPGTPLTIT